MVIGGDDSWDASLRDVLAHYPADCRPRLVEPLGGAGGFSGATFWRLSTDRGLLCLRRWPEQAGSDWPQRLAFIHAVLQHVVNRGFRLVPLPIRTRHGDSFVASRSQSRSQSRSHLWELAPWLSGSADFFSTRRPEKLRAALGALAELHVAAADFPGVDPGPHFSEGLRRRRVQIETLRGGGLRAITTAIEAATGRTVGIAGDERIATIQIARRLLPLYARAEESVLRQLVAAETKLMPLQPCIRDIWHDHVLFDGDRVSGLIDFGALRIDNVAGDVARLLGSLAGDKASAWQDGLAGYEAVRPLSTDERQLVGVFDRGTTLLSGMNWLSWIFVEGRTFSDLSAVRERLVGIAERLERLTPA